MRLLVELQPRPEGVRVRGQGAGGLPPGRTLAADHGRVIRHARAGELHELGELVAPFRLLLAHVPYTRKRPLREKQTLAGNWRSKLRQKGQGD